MFCFVYWSIDMSFRAFWGVVLHVFLATYEFLRGWWAEPTSLVRIHSNKPIVGTSPRKRPREPPIERCESIGKGNASVWDPEAAPKFMEDQAFVFLKDVCPLKMGWKWWICIHLWETFFGNILIMAFFLLRIYGGFRLNMVNFWIWFRLF